MFYAIFHRIVLLVILQRAILSFGFDEFKGFLTYTKNNSQLERQELQKRPLSQQNDFNASLNYFTSSPYYPSPLGGRIEGQWKDAYEKAKELVDNMSIIEQVNLTTGTGWQIGPCVGNTGSVPRLGIPELCLQDGPNGIRFTDFASNFPSGLAVGSTFNKDLMYLRGRAIGKENKAKGINIMLGPTLGPIGLKAAGGRNWEGFGADPYLQGIAGAHTVQGVQEEGVITTIRHLVGNEQEHFRQVGEWDVNGWSKLKRSLSANIGDRVMHEVFLWPFADAVRAGTGAVMCAYNQVNNTYACENSYLINYLLKEELGFQGFVMSDWGAQHTGVNSALAGLDMTMPGEVFQGWLTGKSFWGSELTKAVCNNTISPSRLRDMATRILTPFFFSETIQLALEEEKPNFDSWTDKTYGQQYHSQNYGSIVQKNWHVDVRSELSDKISLSVAREAIVLLKNINNSLPIESQEIRKILVAGGGAGADPKGFNCDDQKCIDGVLSTGWGSAAPNNPFVITPYDAILKKAIERDMLIDFTTEVWDLDQVEKRADFADLVIVVVNADSGEGYVNVDGNYGDRKNLSIWHNGDELISRVSKKCRKTVVVVNSVGQVDLEKWIDNASVVGVLYTAPLGQYTGQAIADVLFGDVNPSGHLPFTIAKNTSDYVPIIDKLEGSTVQDNFERDIFLDYKYFDEFGIEPRYYFGYGLSYTKFEVDKLRVRTVHTTTIPLSDPKKYVPVAHDAGDQICRAGRFLFPHDQFTPVPGFIYPYLLEENAPKLPELDHYEYPNGYRTEYRTFPPGAGGGVGGHPDIWETVYEITANVRNIGDRVGSHVVQLYIELPDTIVHTAYRSLRGFDKISLEPGATGAVHFNILRRDLSIWSTELQQWVIQPGIYRLYLSTSSEVPELSEEIVIGF